MTSSVFYPDNVKRYDRMQQLNNDIHVTKANILRDIEAQEAITDKLDEICKAIMEEKGYKTVDELHEAVMKTLPEAERKAYTDWINNQRKFSETLTKSMRIVGIIGTVAFATSLGVERQMRIMAMARDAELAAQWNRGFRQFWTLQPRAGLTAMNQASKAMRLQMAEAVNTAGPAASRSLRVYKFLQTVEKVATVTAVIALVVDLLLLGWQVRVESQQRDALRETIKKFFYYRFITVAQAEQTRSTLSLYSKFEAYLTMRNILAQTGSLPKEAIDKAMGDLADKMIEHDSMVPENDPVSDKAIWDRCHLLDERGKDEIQVYKEDDPAEDKLQEWLDEQAKENPEKPVSEETKVDALVQFTTRDLKVE